MTLHPTPVMLAETERRREVERRVRAMTKAEKVAYLRAAGWHRRSAHASQSWRDPDPASPYVAWTLAAAIREQAGADLDAERR